VCSVSCEAEDRGGGDHDRRARMVSGCDGVCRFLGAACPMWLRAAVAGSRSGPRSWAAALWPAGWQGGPQGGERGRRVHGPQRADSAGSGRIREERKGEVTGQAGLVRFLGPDAPSFLLLAPLYLLPRALGWCTCVAYRVIPQVGSTRVYYGSRNPMPRVGNSWALTYKEG